MHAMRRPRTMILLFAFFAAGASTASAQQLGTEGEIRSAYNKSSSTFMKLRSGEKEPTKADKEVLDACAKWFVYRFTWVTMKKWEDMAKLRTEFITYQIHPALSQEAFKKNAKFREQFGASLVPAYQALFGSNFQNNRFSIVNSGPTLVEAARMRSDALADFLAELITDREAAKGDDTANKHDIIKFYAIRGLREYYGAGERGTIYEKTQPARPIVPLDADTTVATAVANKAKRDVRIISAVLKFAENRPGVAKLPPEEQQAIRILRRPAIETLAATQAPLVVYGKKSAEAPIAPLLLRVLSPKSDLQPAPDLADKVEAAIGVARMKYKNVEAYQPEVGVYLVGQTIAEFLTAENKDVGVVTAPDSIKVAALNWRISARRLELALKDMVANAKGHKVENAARKLHDGAAPILDKLAKGRPERGKIILVPVEGTQLTLFRKMATTLRPSSNQVFKDMPKFTIDLGGQ